MATIDGKDILTTWRMALLTGSFDSLFRYPTRSVVKYTNYAEVDGIIPALSQFEIEPRKVSLNFMIRHNSETDFWGVYYNFRNAMIADGYRTMSFGTGITHALRYDRAQKMRSIRLFNTDGGTYFTMDFIEDKTAIDPNITTPINGIRIKGVYVVDGMDFGNFGIHPDGDMGEVLKFADIKPPFFDGRKYYPEANKFKHRELTLKFWMLSASQSEFIRNYQAFYNAFAKAGKQQLYIRETDTTSDVYYMDCPAYRVIWTDKPSAFFSIKFCFPKSTQS